MWEVKKDLPAYKCFRWELNPQPTAYTRYLFVTDMLICNYIILVYMSNQGIVSHFILLSRLNSQCNMIILEGAVLQYFFIAAWRIANFFIAYCNNITL